MTRLATWTSLVALARLGCAAPEETGRPIEPQAPMYASTIDSASVALSLDTLRTLRAASDYREVRLWYGFSRYCPMNLVWILDKGSEVTGAHILWCEHYEDTSAGIRDHMVESGCEETDTRWGFDFCEVPIPSGRWTEALRQLEGSELWSLPGDATRGMEDAPGLVVELRDGSSYRSYSYSDFDPAWSRDSGLAWQIVETMFSLKP